MSTLLLHGGRVIDPASGMDETADVLIANGRIAAIETSPGRLPSSGVVGESVERLDAEGLIVAPGLIDIHVHLREPGPAHRETIATGVTAAIRGGFTTVCCMPNTTPPLDSAAMVQFVQLRAAEVNLARVFVVGCATAGRAGESLAEIGTMSRAGAVGFTDDGDVIADASMMVQVLRTVAQYDRCVMQHCQEPTLTRGAAMNAGPVAARLGLTGWPGAAEELILERDLRLNRTVGCRYHGQHLSVAGSVEILRRARAQGQPATGEVTPHHLLLTDDACSGYDTMTKMNPPLRTSADIEALKEGVADGTITVLATDHAPHPREGKAIEFTSAAFGIVGLECALPLYRRALIDDGVIDWPQLLAMMTMHPAEVTGLDRQGLGRLAVGGPADVTVIDPDAPWTIDVNHFASTGRNCPFDGWSVTGRAVYVIAGGRLHRLDSGSVQASGPPAEARPSSVVGSQIEVAGRRGRSYTA